MPGVDRALTASLGLAVLPDHATDADTLLRLADRALYTAKRNGRNRVEVHGDEAPVLDVHGLRLREVTATGPVPVRTPPSDLLGPSPS